MCRALAISEDDACQILDGAVTTSEAPESVEAKSDQSWQKMAAELHSVVHGGHSVVQAQLDPIGFGRFCKLHIYILMAVPGAAPRAVALWLQTEAPAPALGGALRHLRRRVGRKLPVLSPSLLC